jgi:hypothetical protein
MRFVSVLLVAALLAAQENRQARVNAVKRIPGLVAFWDFVETSGDRFTAHQPSRSKVDLTLDPVNYVRDYWNEGRPATMADFPLLGEGPFGNAVEFRAETDPNFRPVLLVPRARFHNSPIDVKGPGRSVTLVAWVRRTAGNHAIAGIWHEGTDLAHNSKQATRVERGMRQYALFAGLAANNGASAAHVSENGSSSFGDKYARNISVTPEKLTADWALVSLRFDNKADTVTSSIDGIETDYWIDNPDKHPFFQWPAKAWREGTYRPPEGKPLRRETIGGREVLTYKFTKVAVDPRTGERTLLALRVNPFYFPHDLFTPESGGPFTIGRVIHSSRGTGFIGWIGGVAVFDRSLKPKHLKRLAAIGRGPDGKIQLIAP